MICKNCGSQINEGQAYCNNCGSPVQTIVSNKSKKDNKKLIIIICSIVAVLLIIGLVIFLVTKNNDDNNYNGDNGIVDNENIENNNTNSDGELVLTENCSGDNKAVANITNGNIIIKRSGSLIDGEYNKEVVLDIGNVKSIASLTSLSCDMTDLMYIDTNNYLYRIKLVNLFDSNFDNKEIIKISEHKVKGFGKNQPYGIEIIMENNDEHRIYSYNDCINETCGLNDAWNNNGADELSECKNDEFCVIIKSDNDLSFDYKIDSVDKMEKYSKQLVAATLIGVGAQGQYSNIEESNHYTLFALADIYLNQSGQRACYKKEYIKGKIYELFDVKNFYMSDSDQSIQTLNNYYCISQGLGGESFQKQIDEELTIEGNKYIYNYKFQELDPSTNKLKNEIFNIIIKFEYKEGFYKLKSVVKENVD